jgi:hypothetical protein
VFDKADGSLVAGPFETGALWAGFPGDCPEIGGTDGRATVLFDRAAGRWVVNIGSYSNLLQCIAVSQTADATGSYYRYQFSYSGQGLQGLLYVGIGTWPDAYYMSYDAFVSSFIGAMACALNRSAMLTGATANQVCFQESTAAYALLPSDLDGTTAPPAGEPNFYLDYDIDVFESPPIWTDNLELYKFHVDWTNPANSTFTGPTSIGVAAFTPLCYEYGEPGECVPQPGTTQQLESAPDQLMFPNAYRNFGSHESLVAAQSVEAGSSGGVRWYEIQDPNGTPVVAQQSTFAPDSNYRWLPSIAMDSAGDLAVGYNISSDTVYPGIRIAGRTPSDPPSTLEAEIDAIDGAGSQLPYCTPSGCEDDGSWGGTAQMSVDPVDDCTFWFTGEYMEVSGSFVWSTRIVSFKFPDCLVATTTALTLAPASVSFGSSGPVVMTATVSPASGAGTPTGTVAFFNGASQVGTAPLSGGVATFNYNPGGLAVGTYSMTAAYSGDTNFSGSTSPPQTLTVTKCTTTTVLTLAPASVTFGSSGPVVMTASVTPASGTGTPTGTVAFFNGANQVGTAPLSGGVATFNYNPGSLAVGSYSMTAAYGGDTSFSGSTSPPQTLTVTMCATTTALALAPASVTFGSSGPVVMTATVSPASGSGTPTGTVAFFNGANQVGTGSLSGGVAIFNYNPGSLAVGPYSMTAAYSGDTNFSGSTAPAQTLNVAAAPDFTISASPTTVTISAPGQSGTATVTITPLNGFSQTISFSGASCSGLPAEASCSFKPSQVTPSGGPAGTTLTVATTAPSSARMTPRRRPLGRGPAVFLALLLPGLLLLGGRKSGKRRFVLGLGMIVLLLAFSLLAFSGCGGGGGGGGGGEGGTPAGNYTVTVTATASSLSHSTTFKLVVQ